MTTYTTAQYHQAHHTVHTTVIENGFQTNHDVDGIVRELWDTFGHFDWDIIGHDTDRYWAILEKHRTI